MKRVTLIQKSFRREINLQTRSVKEKILYTRKMKYKKGSPHDRTFIIEGCVMGIPPLSTKIRSNNAE
jgi:hypothetical protein